MKIPDSATSLVGRPPALLPLELPVLGRGVAIRGLERLGNVAAAAGARRALSAPRVACSRPGS